MLNIPKSQIYLHYPQLKSEMKWSISDLEFFVDSFLLIGTVINNELHINVKSLDKLIQYYQNVKLSKLN